MRATLAVPLALLACGGDPEPTTTAGTTSGTTAGSTTAGSTTTGPFTTESFTAEALPYDVLFVSQYLGQDPAQALVADIPTLFSQMDAHEVDYRVGVTTTDMEDAFNGSGRLTGTHIDPSTTNPDQAFFAALPGSWISPRKMVFDAALAALGPERAADNDLRRSNARLHVVALAPRDDQGTDPVADFTAALLALAPHPSLVRFSAVRSTSFLCAGGDDTFPRLDEAVAATGGLTEDLCAADFGPFMASLAEQGAWANPIFPLTERPLAATEIVVDVQGTEVDPAHWTWDETANTIVFDDEAIPAPGDTVDVVFATE